MSHPSSEKAKFFKRCEMNGRGRDFAERMWSACEAGGYDDHMADRVLTCMERFRDTEGE